MKYFPALRFIVSLFLILIAVRGRRHLYYCLILNILENVHGFAFWLEREALEGSYQKALVKTALSGR